MARREAFYTGYSLKARLVSLVIALALGGISNAEFVHPGCSESLEDLEFAKAQVAAEAEPWATALSSLRSDPDGSLDFQASPRPVISQDFYGDNDDGGFAMLNDGRAAYLHALIWATAGDTAHAWKSIEILNGYSSQLTAISGANAKLIGAIAFIGFSNAAELMRHTFGEWSDGAQDRYRGILQNILRPLLWNFQPGYNGNWDALITQSLMAAGVFLDNDTVFERATFYYESGPGNGSLPNYVWEDGTTQETTRDQGHEQMGIGGLAGTAEIAWHQGIDFYGMLDNRLALGAEGTAERVVATGTHASSIWEKIYNHYHNRLGLPMPKTEAIVATPSFRPEGYGDWNGVGFGTLTHYEVGPTPAARSLSTPQKATAAPAVLVDNCGTTAIEGSPGSCVRIYRMDGAVAARGLTGPHGLFRIPREGSGVFLLEVISGNETTRRRLTIR